MAGSRSILNVTANVIPSTYVYVSQHGNANWELRRYCGAYPVAREKHRIDCLLQGTGGAAACILWSYLDSILGGKTAALCVGVKKHRGEMRGG